MFGKDDRLISSTRALHALSRFSRNPQSSTEQMACIRIQAGGSFNFYQGFEDAAGDRIEAFAVTAEHAHGDPELQLILARHMSRRCAARQLRKIAEMLEGETGRAIMQLAPSRSHFILASRLNSGRITFVDLLAEALRYTDSV